MTMLMLLDNIVCDKKTSVLLALYMFVLTLSVLMLAGGLYILIEYQPLEGDSSTVVAHSNDTILVAEGVDAFLHSNVTVRQCVQKEDDYHASNIYLIQTGREVLKKTMYSMRSPVFYQDLPTFKAGVQSYLYLLPGSTFNYRMCLASTTNQEQIATYFLFDDVVMYWDYTDDTKNGKNYAILSKTFTAGNSNQTKCGEVSYNITKPSYYFMMVNSPANITYSYNFTLDKVEYDVSGFQPSCTLSDYNQCDLSLANGDFQHIKYSVIAYVKPSPFEQSIITHLCLTESTGSSTLNKLAYISDALLAVGSVLSFIITAAFITCLITRRYKQFLRSEVVSEQQKLLHDC